MYLVAVATKLTRFIYYCLTLKKYEGDAAKTKRAKLQEAIKKYKSVTDFL